MRIRTFCSQQLIASTVLRIQWESINDKILGHTVIMLCVLGTFWLSQGVGSIFWFFGCLVFLLYWHLAWCCLHRRLGGWRSKAASLTGQGSGLRHHSARWSRQKLHLIVVSATDIIAKASVPRSRVCCCSLRRPLEAEASSGILDCGTRLECDAIPGELSQRNLRLRKVR